MIPPAPTDFWEQVARMVAKAIFDREMNLERSRFGEKVPNLAMVSPLGQTLNPMQQQAMAGKGPDEAA
jgi:hypothetical protein